MAPAPAAAQVADDFSGPPDYDGLEILSPMVRGASLPLRLCALQYGAGLAYHGVVIDRSILDTVRVENAAFGCVDYVNPREKRVIFSTCEAERKRVIFQVGSCDAALAAKAALHVCTDVRGIDVNMGCTAPFSSSGGMGAALLEKPELVADILKTLRRELPSKYSVSCKIRLLPTLARTRDFLQLCERSGASAVAVHLRTKEQDRDEGFPARWEDAKALEGAVNIPLIANGDFFDRQHISRFWRGLRADQEEGCQSMGEVAGDGGSSPSGGGNKSSFRAVMIARGALWDPSIFWRDRSDHDYQGSAPGYDDVVRNYIATGLRTGTNFFNIKWTLKEMATRDDPTGSWPGFGGAKGKDLGQLRKRIDDARDLAELCRLFGAPYDSAAYPLGAHTLGFSGQFLPPPPAQAASKLGGTAAPESDDEDGDEIGNPMWMW